MPAACPGFDTQAWWEFRGHPVEEVSLAFLLQDVAALDVVVAGAGDAEDDAAGLATRPEIGLNKTDASTLCHGPAP